MKEVTTGNITIINTKTISEDTMYLNHSALNSLSFGSEEMMWTTDNLADARNKAEAIRASGRYANVIEL